MNRIAILLIIVVLAALNLNAQNKHAKSSRYMSYKGLVMAGYQGWFRTPEDGTGDGWVHYGKAGKFDAENVKVDFWPDVADYEKTYKTSFIGSNGKPAEVFSSADKSTTELHFKWMKEYGIDGVFMQRFFGVTRGYKNSDKSHDKILKNALVAANENGRAIAVMYDLSGLKADGEDCSSVIEDWKMLVDQLKVTNQGDNQTYLYHNGKPLVTIWGVGFPDRPYDIRKIGVNRLIDFLKNDPVYGGCSVMLGVPTYFRELDKDCIHDPYLHELIESVDIVLPWMVQRFTPYLQNPIDHQRDHIIADIKWCKEHGPTAMPFEIRVPGALG